MKSFLEKMISIWTFGFPCYMSNVKEKKKNVSVTTAVKFNNALGRVYFFFIKPFHRMIVPILFKRKFKQFELELKR